MRFPLHNRHYLSLLDRLDTTAPNVIDAKKDPELLRKATGYLSRNPNIEELLIRVSDEFEVSPFGQDQAPNPLWNIQSFSTIPPVTDLLQQRSEIEEVVSENGRRITHEYEVLRVRKVHELETPIRVQLEQVIVTEHCILLLTQDPLAGLISQKDIVRISGVHPTLDTRHLIEQNDERKLTAENAASLNYAVLDVDSHGYCAMEATVDNRTVIYRIRRKQNEGNLSMSPVRFQGDRFFEQGNGSLQSPSTPSGQDAVYSPAETRQQGESSEGQSCGDRGNPHEILLLPKCEKHPELQEKIKQITAPVFIENLVKEVGLANIIRVCKNHLFGLEETKEAFEAAFEEVEAKKVLLQSEVNKETFHDTTDAVRTNKQVLLVQGTREASDHTIGNLEAKKSLFGSRKVQEASIGAPGNRENEKQLVGSKETKDAYNDAYAHLIMQERLIGLEEAEEAFGDVDDLFDDVYDDDYAHLDYEDHYFEEEEEDVNEGFDEVYEELEDFVTESPAPAPKPAPARVNSSMIAVNRANRLLGITQSASPPLSLSSNKAASSSHGTPPPLSNRVPSIAGPSRSRHLQSHASHSFEEILNIIKLGIRTRQARTLYLCHERNDALEIRTEFIEHGVDANVRKKGKLNAANFHRDVDGCFVLIVNVQVVLNIIEDMDKDLFSLFDYIVEPVNLNTASCLLRKIKNMFYQVERPSTQWLQMHRDLH